MRKRLKAIIQGTVVSNKVSWGWDFRPTWELKDNPKQCTTINLTIILLCQMKEPLNIQEERFGQCIGIYSIFMTRNIVKDLVTILNGMTSRLGLLEWFAHQQPLLTSQFRVTDVSWIGNQRYCESSTVEHTMIMNMTDMHTVVINNRNPCFYR